MLMFSGQVLPVLMSLARHVFGEKSAYKEKCQTAYAGMWSFETGKCFLDDDKTLTGDHTKHNDLDG